MNIVVKYDEEKEKVTVKIDKDEAVDIEFVMLMNITDKVINDGIDLVITTEGFENAPDLEQNYKKVFEDIQKLKEDQEIIDLKTKITGDENDSPEDIQDTDSEDNPEKIDPGW